MIGAFAGRVVKGSERAAQEAHERTRFFGIGEHRTEDLVLRKEDGALGLGFVDACAAPWCGGRLRFARARQKQQRHNGRD